MNPTVIVLSLLVVVTVSVGANEPWRIHSDRPNPRPGTIRWAAHGGTRTEIIVHLGTGTQLDRGSTVTPPTPTIAGAAVSGPNGFTTTAESVVKWCRPTRVTSR